MKLDLLAIGAHPDDVELTCGGTIAKCIKYGYKVGILDLTEGELGTRGNRKIRRLEAQKAAKILGVKVRENLRIPDGNIQVNKQNISKVIGIYRKYKPDIILIPHWQERHPDHVHAHHLCREAQYYSGLRKISIKTYGKKLDAWRPGKYFNYMQKYEFTPSFIIDISDVYDIRLNAIKAHKSQFYDPNSMEPETFLSSQSFLDFMETRIKYYGQQIGVKYGEPFYSVEPIGIDNVFSLKLFSR